MKLTADTNILLRASIADDAEQAELARRTIAEAELVAVPITVLCEFAWVLSRQYKLGGSVIAGAIRHLTQSANIVVHQPIVEAGLQLLEAGGDFADGVIAFEGKLLGADIFATFDKQAAHLIKKQGGSVHLLTPAS